MRILLIGAGFSRNWGAPLSEEINGSLLSHLHNDPVLAKRLRTQPFEEVFGGFSSAVGPDADRQARLQAAITATFDRVNVSFHISNFEFNRSSPETQFSIRVFLQKFNVIFSLNQDLLLEKVYIGNGNTRNVLRPGLQRISEHAWRPDGQHQLPLGSSVQPLVKLHGSSDWVSSEGASLMILGNAKSGAIARIPLLKWYHEEFRAQLRAENAKLMVIGYSFQDEHINEVIFSASKERGLGTFIVDPRGSRVLRDPTMAKAHIPGPPHDIEDIKIVGELRRTLREIFSGDRFAIGELNRFF